MGALFPKDEESVYAAEGTAAHTLAEIRSRAEILGEDSLSLGSELHQLQEHVSENGWDMAEMEMHVEKHIALIRSRLDETPGATVLLEKRMDTGIPGCWGTSDVVIVSPDLVEIIDLKYGKGVKVYAHGNAQLRLYALGALNTFSDILGYPRRVRMTVHQPRLDHIESEELDTEDLLLWKTVAETQGRIALGDNPPFGPSDSACHWCPASGRCRAQLESVFGPGEGAPEWLEDPRTLSLLELAQAYARIDMVRQWANACEEACLDTAYHQGLPVPGYKVVLSGGRRKIEDQAAAIEHLTARGFDLDEVSHRKIRGFGELEQLLGDRFDDYLGPYVSKSDGKPSIVKDSDQRPAVSAISEARKDFKS